MKRIFIFVLVTMMLFANSASAEKLSVSGKFSIRNGISFGMSRDEVMQIESDNGSILHSPADDGAEIFPGVSLCYTTDLLGYKCDILYYFKSDGTLFGFKYHLTSYSAYNDVVQSLCKKYGYPTTINTRSPFQYKTNTYRLSSQVSKIVKYWTPWCWWLIEFEDCSVCIETSQLETKAGNKLYLIDYTIFSHEAADDVLDSKQDSADEDL